MGPVIKKKKKKVLWALLGLRPVWFSFVIFSNMLGPYKCAQFYTTTRHIVRFDWQKCVSE